MNELMVHVAMGEVAVSNEEEAMLESFVGSCVAFCLYDPNAKIAGMAHIVLPDSSQAHTSSNFSPSGKYADQAVETLVKMMNRKGGNVKRFRAKMAGGANMFTHESGISLFDIGKRNAEALRKILKEKKIPLIAEDIGLNHGRRIKFSIKSGEVIVSSKNNVKKL